ncbi:uncharacterized protein LOC134690217 [Mytilus trossulus]|uniref:uncharacterized protein LOC134690217 n=1 Tax=Mytilus trossulus TaxID=6551 RepID=UPI003005F8DE
MSRRHELLDINIKPTNINISDQRCSEHEDLPFEYFCVDHDILCCKECQVETHRSCQKVMSVDIASKGIKRSQSFIDAIELIEHVLITVPIITEDRQTLIDSIEKDANVIRDEIRKVKEEAISHIEYLEKLLLEDLKHKKEKILNNAKVTITEIQDIGKIAREKKDTFDIVEKHGSEKQVFFAVHAYKTVLADLEQKISTITEQTTNLSIKLNADVPKKSIISIGTIDTIEVSSSKEFIQRKKRQSQIPTLQQQILPIFIEKQGATRLMKLYDRIKGIKVNHYNELIISTSNLWSFRYAIQVFENNKKRNYEMIINREPWQIVLVPGQNRGIITLSKTNIIQFVDLNTCKVLNEISIEGCKEGGVAASNENIFVGTKGNIKVLNHNGRHIRSIKMNNNKLTPRYIALDKSGNIYHSDSEVICCTTIDGKHLFTYKPSENHILHGVAIDCQGYVYVVVQTQGVYRLRSDGTFSDLVVNEDGNGPFFDICFDKDCTKLYISKEHGVLEYTRQ